MNSKILAIESSCDDTSISILHDGRILSNIVASQAIHIQYGGVVPESASRAHMENILPVLNAALDKANTKLEEIDCIAVTRGPGLLGSLIVGITFAKGLALGLNKPLIEINHLQAHVASLLIDNSDITFPFLCLTVSGGHTQLVLVKQNLEMSIIAVSYTHLHEEGTGAQAEAGKTVSVNYYGALISNGERFDDSFSRGEEFSFPLGAGQVIKGWDEGIALMKEGSKATFFIPYQLAYGEAGSPPVIPTKADLMFYVEMNKVK